jgi:methylmalonyl-CoA mutase N-terminal domain/subunit
VEEYLKKINSLGGAVRAIEQQFYQNEIAESAYKYQQAIERKEKIIVGVNEFISRDAAQPPLMKIDDSVRMKQMERLKTLKSKRNTQKVASSLSRLKSAAQGKENIIPFILECVESYVTLGEISDTLRSVWGEY